MATHKCGCIYADRNNTEAVRKGYEMGGYVKQWCKEHAPTQRRAAAMTNVKVTDQCIEMRVVVPRHAIPSEQSFLQYRSLRICVDASGALCPNGYTEWINVPTVASNADFSAAMDQRETPR